MKQLDIVGHFGTTLSYATVGSNVARAVRNAGLLGTVSNLDAGWHDSFEDLRTHKPKGEGVGTHVLLFTPPHHYIDTYANLYGRDKSAIFMSPNTDRLAEDHAETCLKFGFVATPSKWCERVVQEGLYAAAGAPSCPSEDDLPQIKVLPLGVSPRYVEGHVKRLVAIQKRSPTDPIRVLHFSTDQFFPGRKGTEELLDAWSRLSDKEKARTKLTIHHPRALTVPLTYLVRALDVEADLVVAPERGGDIEMMLQLFDNADLVVAPSRCEGFGLMLLSSLVAGVPLLCTAQTGSYDFLRGMGGWLGVPTVEWGPIPGEEGEAPIIDPRMLTASLRVVLSGDALQQLAGSVLADRGTTGTHTGTWLWPVVLRRWLAALVQWMEESHV